jgi:hypothetical protein
MFRNFRTIGKNDVGDSQAVINEIAAAGGGLCIILPEVEKGPIFERAPKGVTVLDLRYGGSLTFLGGNHPRKEGIWTQYSHLSTGLARNVVVSDSISNDTPIEDWTSNEHTMQLAPYGEALSSEDYRHLHNHYQNFLSEVYNFSNSLNGVAIWGDSGAFVPGAKSWGGFFSARSWPIRWNGYTPESVETYADEDFDAALVGIEIDVLNAGRDWGDVSPALDNSLAKVGLQVVGFGARNTAAIEVRTEDSDDPNRDSSNRRGAWNWGIIVRNALHENSTLIHCENGRIRRGLDMSLSTFTEGAVRITAGGEQSGIVYDGGASGEVYAEKDGTLVVKGGEKGVKILCGHGNYMFFSPDGTVSMSDSIKKSLRRALLEQDEGEQSD